MVGSPKPCARQTVGIHSRVRADGISHGPLGSQKPLGFGSYYYRCSGRYGEQHNLASTGNILTQPRGLSAGRFANICIDRFGLRQEMHNSTRQSKTGSFGFEPHTYGARSLSRTQRKTPSSQIAWGFRRHCGGVASIWPGASRRIVRQWMQQIQG